uniref:Uncharacterized protein n=1 Tax=uncultured Armatimonadetes bacterium TaxID=157466 RepID=A0A6J4HQH7_9BACT|nr:hypothetical protein AVDCRST_MAG63-886 [uncultured Armatimonadetes bacterium]
MSTSDTDAPDGLGRTALHWAAWMKGADETRRLLDRGAFIEAKDCYRWTPLTVAVRAGQAEAVQVLLERGAGIPGPDVYGETVLTMALRRGYAEVARLLQEAGAREPTIIEQARDTGVNAVPLLRLEKTTYRRGEPVWFWVGVRPLTDEPIPRHLWHTTKLHIRQPDGTRRTERGGWPRDGCPDRGWEGADGLRLERPEAGIYALAFEFAALQTEPAEIVIESG